MNIKEALIALAIGKKIYVRRYGTWYSLSLTEVESSFVLIRKDTTTGDTDVDTTLGYVKSNETYLLEVPTEEK